MEKHVWVCTDGTPAMLRSKSGFLSRVKKLAPLEPSASTAWSTDMLSPLRLSRPLCRKCLITIIKIVNYVKIAALKTWLFKKLCKDRNADHEFRLFYTVVSWLSKGKVVNRDFEMKDEIKLFLEVQEKKNLEVYFEDEAWNKRFVYFADIFDQLNKINLMLQGKETHSQFSR